MFKRLLIALYILLVFAVVPAHADPVSALIAGVGTILKAGGIGAMLIKTAFSLAIKAGLSLYAQARQRHEARKARAAGNGVTLTVQMGDTVERAYLIGDRATAGTRYYIGYWGEADGTPNAYITDCVVLSCLPSRQGPQGLKGVYVGKRTCTPLWGEPHPDGRGYPLSELRVNGVDYGWIKYHDGTQTEADPFLLSKFGAHADRPYLASMIGRGCQIAILTIRQNADLYNNSLQTLLVWPKPMKLYDLSRDSSAGGDGPQRWDAPETWGGAGDNLLPVMAYNVARGLYYRGRWVHGGRNFAPYRLPASSWIAAINEAARAGADGNPQYRGGLEVSVASQPLDAIEDMRAGCSGRFAEVGGQIKLLVGAPGAAVYTFTDEDIVVTEDQKSKPFASLKETYNTATASYPEPAQLWTAKDAPEYAPDELLARDDGERLPMALELDPVPYAVQVDLIKKTALEEAQRWRTHEAYFGPGARALEPNDPIAWTSAAENYANKAFVVVRATPVSGLRTLLVYKELDPADYNPPAISLPPVPGPTGALPVPVQVMPGWQVFPDAIRDDAGVPRQPAVRVKCGGGLDGVTHVSVDVRIRDTGQTVFSGFPLPYRAPYEWTIGPLPGETWVEAEGTLVSTINANQQSSAWIAVRTPAAATDLIVDLAHIGADVRSTIKGLAARFEQFSLLMERMNVDMSLAAATGEHTRQQILQEMGQARAELTEETLVRATETESLTQFYQGLRADFAANAASIQTLLTTMANESEALAQQITQLFATTGSISAAAVAETTARINGESALASSISGVSADFNGRFAQGLIQFEAAAAPAGVDARFAVLVRAGTSDGYKMSGLYIDVYTEGGMQRSRVVILTDQFVVSDGTSTALPLVFAAGILKLANVRVDFAQIDNVVIDWAKIESAVINNLVVGTSNLDFSVVTDFTAFSTSVNFGTYNASNWMTVQSVTINNPNPNPVLCDLSGAMNGSIGNSGSGTFGWRFINLTTGEVIYSTTMVVSSSSSNGASRSIDISAFKMGVVNIQGGNTYAFQLLASGSVSGTGGTASASVKLIWWKR